MSIWTAVLPLLSVSAICSTIGLFLCGLQICSRIRQRGGTEGIGSAPFLIASLSCASWLQYGVLKADSTVILVNIVGFMLQSTYLSYYYYMTRNRRFLRRMIAMEVCIIIVMLYLINFGDLSDQGTEPLGYICIVLNIINIGAPLFQVGEVIRSKSSESLPFPLCIACFFVSLQWLLYGIIVNDFIIQAPNYVATVLSIVQLSLFIIYPRKPSTKYMEVKDNIY